MVMYYHYLKIVDISLNETIKSYKTRVLIGRKRRMIRTRQIFCFFL